MSKEAPQIPDHGKAESIPSQEGWFQRHRGKIAFILGMALGTVSGSQAINQTDVDATPAKRSSLLARDGNPVWSEIKSAVESMPSICEVKNGTFYDEIPRINSYCKSQGEDPKESSCPVTLKDLQWIEKDANMRRQASDYLFSTAATKDVEVEGVEKAMLTALESIPESYRSLLRDFDPATYRVVRRFVYLKEEGCDAYAGVTEGPYSLVGDQLVRSQEGVYYLVKLNDGLEEDDINRIMDEGDRQRIRKFIRNVHILAHEIFGHVRVHSEFDRGEDPTNRLFYDLQNELHAHFMGARMIAYIANKWPIVRRILRDDWSTEENIRYNSGIADLCEIGISVVESERNAIREATLKGEAALYRSFMIAQRFNDWTYFKRAVLTTYMKNDHQLSQYSGLPFIMNYYRQQGDQSKFKELNEKLEKTMNVESPERFFPVQ